MGIYIPNMEIPKGIEMLVVFSDGTVHKCLPGIHEYVEKGTAIPVPPHGRLIDADAEVARVQNLYNKAVAKDPEMGCVSVYEGEIAVLKLAPTIIPAEEGE